MYERTLIVTRLGHYDENRQLVEYSKDQQIYYLFLDGIVFEEFNRYNELLEMFEPQN